jgi:hypothetical protein
VIVDLCLSVPAAMEGYRLKNITDMRINGTEKQQQKAFIHVTFF